MQKDPACEQCPGRHVYMYELTMMGPVGMAQKFNFYLPHWRCAELDQLTIQLIDKFSNFMKYW